MAFSEHRPNWLSGIIQERRIVSDRPIPLDQRKAERDAIVAAIREHPEGQCLADIDNLPDIVWAAMGSAYHWEQESKRNPHLDRASPAIHASIHILSTVSWEAE
jgi:hypothetical protein